MLILVEREREGFERGRNLEKIGYKAQDTSELFFDNVRVPVANLLGGENHGFVQLIEQLPQERLLVAMRAATVIEYALEWTVNYTTERKAFGRSIASFQALKHRCVDMMMRAEASAVSVEMALEAFSREAEEAPVAASEAKFYSCDSYVHVAKEGLQMHGGVGFTWEYDAHLFLRRAASSAILLGDAAWHHERTAHLVQGASRSPSQTDGA